VQQQSVSKQKKKQHSASKKKKSRVSARATAECQEKKKLPVGGWGVTYWYV
jgi:hypothetical protein